MSEIERLFEYQLELSKNEKNPLIFYFICEFNNEPDRMEYEARSIQSFFSIRYTNF